MGRHRHNAVGIVHTLAVSWRQIDIVSFGSFLTEAANFAARPTSASPRKLTSDLDEKLVAMGHQQTHALQHDL
jgi:hypothetical protein